MKKRILFIVLLSISVFTLVACSANMSPGIDNNYTETEDVVVNLGDNTPERKIIYNVDLSIYAKDLKESINTLKANIASDEWFDYERIRDKEASFTIRIKTSRLDQFIKDIEDLFDVSHYNKTGTDISLKYLDTTNKIAGLQAQHDRLMILYASASLNEMITIDKRLGEIETELLTLEGTLNTFDSLVDYSEVKLNIYESKTTSKSPFFNRLFRAFGNGVKGLISFFDGLLIGISTILPFLIIAVPSSYGIYILVKKYKKRKVRKENEEE